jgi:transposase
MGLKQKIIIGHFTDGKSERKLVKEFKLHRKTVHRYVVEHQALLADRTVTDGQRGAYNALAPKAPLKS